MIAAYHGYLTDLPTLRRKFSVSLKGMTLAALSDTAAQIGLGARALRCELQELCELRTPAILHWGMKHFVVLKRASRNWIEIHDPAAGARRIHSDEISRRFTGVALELTPTDGFRPRRERSTLTLSSLVDFGSIVKSGLAQAVVLSLVIELLVLAAPFYMQLVIDEAILKGDTGFLTAIAIGFAAVALFNTLASAMRSLTLQYLATTISFELEAKVFNRLLRLPLDWFQKRHVGDIQSRFQSAEHIKAFLTQGAVTALMDGFLSVFVLWLMFYYSDTLGWLAVATVVMYGLLRLATLELSRRVASDFLINQAQESTRFLESLRAIQTLKAAGAEVTREALQRNAMAATLNSGVRAGNVGISLGAASQLINGLSDVLVVFLGANAVINADMTIGMLTAFIAYQKQFSARCVSLVECIINWRLLDVHLERLSDIVLSPTGTARIPGRLDQRISGAVEAVHLVSRYASGEPDVLRGASLKVSPGEFVALTGPSGCGKTTFVKILAGLQDPSFGHVLIDGHPISRWNPASLRSQLALVAQDDCLLQGSIAENIASFDDQIDMSRVRESAVAAQIHDEIDRMPMGYESLVGDMGSALSGGQRQRVLIARALYRRPRILILDEGTSHLDVDTERAVNAALSELAVTRIVVAHRADTIGAADRVVSLAGGVARDISNANERGYRNENVVIE